MVLLNIESVVDIERLFPSTPAQMHTLVHKVIAEASEQIESLYNIKVEEMTFTNTLLIIDRIIMRFTVVSSILQTLDMLGSTHMKKAARKQLSYLESAQSALIDYNEKLYSMVKQYKKSISQALTEEQNMFLEDLLQDWHRGGLDLPPRTTQRIRDIEKELEKRSENITLHITFDAHILHVHRNELPGVPETYLKDLTKTPDGAFQLRADTTVLETCTRESTRFAFWRILVNKGYPENDKELEHIIALRDELAKLLGFPSFAHLDISSQMAKTPERVEAFLTELINACHLKLKKEMDLIKDNLPPDIHLINQEQLKPWDLLYVKHYYKEHILKIDEDTISQYFPLDHVLDTLFSFAENFFAITLKKVSSSNLWYSDLTLVEVHKDNCLRGFIILDLFSRNGKYPYILEQPILPSFIDSDNAYKPGLTIITAHFSYPTAKEPSLLRLTEITTFFHEFGHTLHTLLGAQKIICQSGSRVKRDFVEMPSQLLEQWVWDSTILKILGCHYKTDETLSDDIVEKLMHLKYFDSADITLEQCYYAFLSLECHKEGRHKNIFELHKKLFTEIRTNINFSVYDHSYAAFDHLVAYGAKYYGYLWSRVFATDILYYIKDHMSNPEEFAITTSRYVEGVIGAGGSKDPYTLLKQFLGRDPAIEPFVNDITR